MWRLCINNKYFRYSIRQINNQALTKSLKDNFVKNGYKENLNNVYKRSEELFKDNKDASKKLKYHLNQILPCIAFYEELINIKENKEETLKLFDLWAYDEIYKMKKIVKKLCKLGLYKKIPNLFDFFFNKLFNEDAGFKLNELEGIPQFSRDIAVCPYNETCIKYNHPELTKYFCKSDIITYSSMHDKLEWSRTKTIGSGDECCNFRLHQKNNKIIKQKYNIIRRNL